jgi:hypothetical protein
MSEAQPVRDTDIKYGWASALRGSRCSSPLDLARRAANGAEPRNAGLWVCGGCGDVFLDWKDANACCGGPL